MGNFLIKKFIKTPDDTKNPAVRAAYGKLSGAVGIALNIILFIGKIIVGVLSGSVSVTADAVNNLSDASSSVISLIGFRLAEKPADDEHPYGHGRYEYVAGLTVSFLILIIGFSLARSSIEKIISPEKTVFSWVTILVLAASMLVKGWMMLFNTRAGKKIDSETLIATASDSRNDVITSFAVAAAAVLSYLLSVEFDGWMGLAVALFILYSGVGLIRDTLDPLLGRAPEPDFVEHIHEVIVKTPGVLGAHDLMVHDYGPGRVFASAHVEMAAEGDVCESHDVIDNIERYFLEKEGLHIVLHYDPIVTSDSAVGELRNWIAQKAVSIDPRLTIHDLRIVRGPTHTNVIFDLVAPPSFSMTNAQLKKEVSALIKAEHPDYNSVITVERSFAPLQIN